MTTSIKIRTNGSYVAEAKNAAGNVIGKSGPGNNVESEWIGLPHDGVHSIVERAATAEEVEAAKPKAE